MVLVFSDLCEIETQTVASIPGSVRRTDTLGSHDWITVDHFPKM